VTTDTVNSSNRLTVATSPAGKVEFTYDYMGRRVEKKVFQLSSGTFQLVKTERFVYDGFKQIEKLDGGNSNAVLQKITWQPERLGQDVPLSIVAVNSDSTTVNYYYFTDANKNVGQLMGAAGNIVAKYEYSPFGEVTAQSGAYADANAFRFSSEYADAETGLVYYNYRYYYPMMGKWISRDPIEEKGGENMNEFIFNSPIDFYDRLGTSVSDETQPIPKDWKPTKWRPNHLIKPNALRWYLIPDFEAIAKCRDLREEEYNENIKKCFNLYGDDPCKLKQCLKDMYRLLQMELFSCYFNNCSFLLHRTLLNNPGINAMNETSLKSL